MRRSRRRLYLVATGEIPRVHGPSVLPGELLPARMVPPAMRERFRAVAPDETVLCWGPLR
jgi:hypothetical protein